MSSTKNWLTNFFWTENVIFCFTCKVNILLFLRSIKRKEKEKKSFKNATQFDNVFDQRHLEIVFAFLFFCVSPHSSRSVAKRGFLTFAAFTVLLKENSSLLCLAISRETHLPFWGEISLDKTGFRIRLAVKIN